MFINILNIYIVVCINKSMVTLEEKIAHVKTAIKKLEEAERPDLAEPIKNNLKELQEQQIV